jgi:hypothetical protein
MNPLHPVTKIFMVAPLFAVFITKAVSSKKAELLDNVST